MTILSANKDVCENYEVWSSRNFIVSKKLYLKIAKKQSLWIDKRGRDHTIELKEDDDDDIEVDFVDGYIDDDCDDDSYDDDSDDHDDDDDDDDDDEDNKNDGNAGLSNQKEIVTEAVRTGLTQSLHAIVSST